MSGRQDIDGEDGTDSVVVAGSTEEKTMTISKTTRRTAEAVAPTLEAGEQVLAAFGLTVRRSGHLERWAETADLAAALPELASRHEIADGLRSADRDFPSGIIAAVTDRRLLLLGRSAFGRPGESVAVIDLVATTLDVVERGERARSWLFVFGLPDGTVVAAEAGVNGGAADEAAHFVSTFREASAAAASA